MGTALPWTQRRPSSQSTMNNAPMLEKSAMGTTVPHKTLTNSSTAKKVNVSSTEDGTIQAVSTIAVEPEQLERRFNSLSMLSACISLTATWEAISSTMVTGLVSGGPVSLIYGFILAFIGSICTALSLSECASMYPTAGGQYHFADRLAPSFIRRPISWASGWVTTAGWLSFAGSAPFLAATMIQGLLVLNYPDYVYERYHGTLIYLAILLFSLMVNIFLAQSLPLIEMLSMTLHVIFFVILLVVMVVVAPNKNSATFVFTEFSNESGWSSNGVAWCIGMLSASYVLSGYDAATHLSEEMDDPAKGVPTAMVGTIVVNGALGFAFLVAILFCIQDLPSALGTSTGFPIIQIFYQVTRGNVHAASAMTSALIVMACLATVPCVAASARVLWAFARDSGVPFSGTLSKVDEKRGVPTVSVIVSTILLAILGLLNIASTTAFNAILSLGVVGLYVSYLIPVILIFYQRLRNPDMLDYGPFKLGRWALLANAVSIAYTIFTSIFLLFPPYQPVTALNMNYASVVLGGILIVSVIYWFTHGRKNYDGPIIELVSRTESRADKA